MVARAQLAHHCLCVSSASSASSAVKGPLPPPRLDSAGGGDEALAACAV